MASAFMTLLCGAVDPFDHGVPVTCTLPAGHVGDDHEDRVTDGCITVWSTQPAAPNGPAGCLYRDDPGYPGPQYCDCCTCAG